MTTTRMIGAQVATEAIILARNRRDLDQMMASQLEGGLQRLGLLLRLCRVTLLLLLLEQDIPHRRPQAQEAPLVLLLRRLLACTS